MGLIALFVIVAALAWVGTYLGDPETGAGSRVEYHGSDSKGG